MTVPQGNASTAVKRPRLPPRWFIRSFWVGHRAALTLSGGRLGLRMATPERWGMFRLHTIGRRSGARRAAILGYIDDGENLVTLAANAMAPNAPAWWLNLEAKPEATVDLPSGTRRVRARAAIGTERERLWALWAIQDRDLDLHAAARGTEIPVVVLEPMPAAEPAA